MKFPPQRGKPAFCRAEFTTTILNGWTAYVWRARSVGGDYRRIPRLNRQREEKSVRLASHHLPFSCAITLRKQRGASFFNDLVRASGRLASEVEDALWELVAAGRVTADGFENLRALIDPKRRKGEGRGRSARPRHAAGRWDLMPRQTQATDHTEFFARQLLDRWGVVFRDVLARETLAPPWRTLLQIYRLWEARGEVRGGRFVSGFNGEQFARPEAVDLLRSVRRNGATGEELSIAFADPLNLTGIILPGARVSPLEQGWLNLRDGVAVEAPARDVTRMFA